MKTDYALRTELERFLQVCKDAGLTWQFIDEHIKRCEDKTQDFLHALELEPLDERDYAVLALKEKINRKERRAYKDEKALVKPLATYLSSPAGKVAVQSLQTALADIRREETRQANRQYRKKAPEEIKEEKTP